MRTLVLGLCLAAILAAVPASAQNGPFDISGALTTEDTRLTTGVESVSASGSKGQQHLLIDFMLTAPLGSEVSRTTKPAATAWLNARFNGATVNTVSNVKQFVGGFEDDLVSGDIGNLLNALTFRAGLEFKLTPGDRFNFGGDFQFQPTLLVGFGVQTVPALDAPSFFELPVPTGDPADKSSNLPFTRWGIPTDKKEDGTQKYKYVALTGPGRVTPGVLDPEGRQRTDQLQEGRSADRAGDEASVEEHERRELRGDRGEGQDRRRQGEDAGREEVGAGAE